MLTTHLLDEAEALADRVAILLGGRIREVATPDRIGRRDRSSAIVRFAPPHDFDVDVDLTRDGDAVIVETDRPAEFVADLVARHGEPDGLTITRPSLEDVYLDMVSSTEVSS